MPGHRDNKRSPQGHRAGNDRDRVGKFFDEYPVLGTLDTLERFVELYDIERLILAAGPEAEPVLLRQLRSFRYRGIELIDFVALSEELAQEIPLDHIDDEWLFMASMNNSRFHIRRLKRLTDILVSSVGLREHSVHRLQVSHHARGCRKWYRPCVGH